MGTAVESAETFKRDEQGNLTPEGQAERWVMEFHVARERLKKWHGQAEKILDRYLDERDKSTAGDSRLNLFTANVETQKAMLYGQTPKVSAGRRYADANDPVARTAATMLERLLNTDIERDGDGYCSALEKALEDRLLPGFGIATARYVVKTEETPAEPPQVDEVGNEIEGTAVEAGERKVWENVETDYRYWKSVLWSPARTFDQVRWFAFCEPMTRDALTERFPEFGASIPLNTKTNKKGADDAIASDPWARADVWEIWCKEDRTVYWYVEGFDKILDAKPDPLGLDNFYPFPKPMVARATTRNFLPRPDFVLAQDIYNEIDSLSTRIRLLEDAIRLAGVFDKGSPEVVKLLSEAGFNKLYPAENFALLKEKGGLAGVVDWFPLENVAKAIALLTEKRAEKIGLLQQVTGWSDIMRGQSSPSETLGAQKLKSQYGSVRIRAFQQEFASFASGLQRIKAEIIAKHFDVATIIERSNILATPDAQYAEQAAQLIKDRISEYRIEIKDEAINLQDYATLRQERAEGIQALGGLMAAMAPLIQAGGPPAVKFTLAAGAWLMAGIKGGASLEAEFDALKREVEQAAAQPKPPPPPDPKVEADKAKAQASIAVAGAKVQEAKIDQATTMAEGALRLKEIQAETLKNALTPAPVIGPPQPGVA